MESLALTPGVPDPIAPDCSRTPDACTPVGYGQHCLVGKAFADGLLEQLVCFLVHTCCGLVDAQDLEHGEGVGRRTEKRVSLGSCPSTSPQLPSL